MTILMIAEARSGSTNLAKWLKKSLPDFNLLNEPFNYRSSDYVGETGTIDYSQDNIISEKYFFNETLIQDMVDNSDIIFTLHREDSTSQIESYIMAHKTNNWYKEYTPTDVYGNIDESIQTELDKFYKSKEDFKKYIVDNNLTSFTYENLYFNNQIDKLKSFLNIESDIQFPYGNKYRKDVDKKTII